MRLELSDSLGSDEVLFAPGIIQPNARFRGDECGSSTVAETRGNSMSPQWERRPVLSFDGGAETRVPAVRAHRDYRYSAHASMFETGWGIDSKVCDANSFLGAGLRHGGIDNWRHGLRKRYFCLLDTSNVRRAHAECESTP